MSRRSGSPVGVVLLIAGVLSGVVLTAWCAKPRMVRPEPLPKTDTVFVERLPDGCHQNDMYDLVCCFTPDRTADGP